MGAIMTEAPPPPSPFADIPYWQNNMVDSIEIKPPHIEDDFIQFGWKDFPTIVNDSNLKLSSHSPCTMEFEEEEDPRNVSPTSTTASIYDMNTLAAMVAHKCATQISERAEAGSGSALMASLPNTNILNNLSLPTSNGPPSSCTSSSSYKKNHRRRSVSKKLVVKFNLIRIREHCVTVGDHDWCEGQLPLSLDWKAASKEQIYHIDEYETSRRRNRMPRGKLPKLDYWQRKSLLRRVAGLTERDMMRLETRRHKKIMINSYADLKRSKTVTHFFQSQELL